MKAPEERSDGFFECPGLSDEQKRSRAEFLAWVDSLPITICGYQRERTVVMDEYGNLIHLWNRVSADPEGDVLRSLKSFGVE